LLETAESEIRATGLTSLELLHKMSKANQQFDSWWAYVRHIVEDMVKEKRQRIEVEMMCRGRPIRLSLSLPDVWKQLSKFADCRTVVDSVVDLATIKLAGTSVKQTNARYLDLYSDNQFDCEAMPNTDAVDKILRYEAAIERSLDRAIARLQWLQQRRKNVRSLPESTSDPVN